MAEPASSGQPLPSSRLRRWLREPLLQFLFVALALFVVYRVLNPSQASDASSNRIELTEDDLVQMSVAWLAQGRSPPTAEQMRNLIELKVREEVLYREGLALGLDKEDTIVKRRLAQKMEFLSDEGAFAAEPTGEELRAWFKSNAQSFALPPRISFRHLYFSTDQRGEQAAASAELALAALAGKSADWPGAASLADPFMFQDYYGDRSFDEMAKQFGPDFAQALVKLKPGAWLGPIQSGYGWHLVFLDALTPARIPEFEEIEPSIKSEYVADQRLKARRQAYERMRARYQVVLPQPPAK
jgi:hypothetical protein